MSFLQKFKSFNYTFIYKDTVFAGSFKLGYIFCNIHMCSVSPIHMEWVSS